ncbi:hypothetical protein L3X38_042272 [Prunus dulcis]|uniref:Uncharacterized protein n=1 Tax=Prunus dulcis TaxID=3755 RepID=A0AAD4UUV3_PRUDU|nr:hypothetical protein L3X38_042272 [Prunus dulcis]
MGDLLGSPRVASPPFSFLTFRLSWASAFCRGCSLFFHGPVTQRDNRVNDVGCPKRPTGHAIAMGFTPDAVLFQSRVHGPNSEVGTQICGLPDLPLHARRSSSSSVASAICPTSPRGARFQLTRRWKGTKMKNSGTDPLPKLLGLFSTSFRFNCR